MARRRGLRSDYKRSEANRIWNGKSWETKRKSNGIMIEQSIHSEPSLDPKGILFFSGQVDSTTVLNISTCTQKLLPKGKINTRDFSTGQLLGNLSPDQHVKSV